VLFCEAGVDEIADFQNDCVCDTRSWRKFVSSPQRQAKLPRGFFDARYVPFVCQFSETNAANAVFTQIGVGAAANFAA